MMRGLWSAAVGGMLVACLAAFNPALGQGQFDQIFPQPGKGTLARGTILDNGMRKNEDVLDVMGEPRKFPVNEILRITFSDDTTDLNAARTAVFQRNYNHALQSLHKVDPQRLTREFVRQDYEFYKALCLAKLAMTEGGDKSAAITAMLNFAKAAPENYHFYEAAEMLGDLAMASGKYADAAKYYTPIASAPWSDYQLLANYSVGRALIGEKQFDQALEKFE